MDLKTPINISITNDSKEVTSFRYFKVNFPQILNPGEFIKLAVKTSEELDYYMTLNNDAGLTVAKQEEPIGGKTLNSIWVYGQPNKRVYVAGEALDLDGLVIYANFTLPDGTSSDEPITGYTISPYSEGDPVNIMETELTFSYTYNGVTQTAIYTIQVYPSQGKYVTDIYISTYPYKTVYTEGEYLDLTDLQVVSDIIEDGVRTTEILDNSQLNFTPDLSTPLTTSVSAVQIEYVYDNASYYATYGITVNAAERVLEYIQIYTLPNKTDYQEGELFDQTGMTVQATYSQGIDTYTETIYVYNQILPSMSTGLTLSDTDLEVSYTYGGITETALVQGVICVYPATGTVVRGIQITTQPDKTTYTEGEAFDPTGMVVEATYITDGAIQSPVEINDYVVDTSTPLPIGDSVEVQVTYTYNGKTVSTYTTVEVDRWKATSDINPDGTLLGYVEGYKDLDPDSMTDAVQISIFNTSSVDLVVPEMFEYGIGATTITGGSNISQYTHMIGLTHEDITTAVASIAAQITVG